MQTGRNAFSSSAFRFSQMTQDKPLRTSWERKMKERQEKQLVKDFARQLQEEKQREREVTERGTVLHTCCSCL